MRDQLDSVLTINSGSDYVIQFTEAIDPEGETITYENEYFNESGL